MEEKIYNIAVVDNKMAYSTLDIVLKFNKLEMTNYIIKPFLKN